MTKLNLEIGDFFDYLREAFGEISDVAALACRPMKEVTAHSEHNKISSWRGDDYDEYRNWALNTQEAWSHFCLFISGKTGSHCPAQSASCTCACNCNFKWALQNIRDIDFFRAALLSVDLMIDTLWMLKESKIGTGILRPKINESLEFDIDFSLLTIHLCKVRIKATDHTKVEIKGQSDKFYGWKPKAEDTIMDTYTAALQKDGVAAGNTTLLCRWYPNFREFYVDSQAQLITHLRFKPTKRVWEHKETIGLKIVDKLDRSSYLIEPDSWKNNIERYETIRRTTENIPAIDDTQPSDKITFAVCIPYGRLSTSKWRDAYAYYLNIAMFKNNSNFSITSRKLTALHRHIDDIRYTALQTLAAGKLAEMEAQAAELKARQEVYQGVMPEVNEINNTIASLQRKIQFVNSRIAPAAEGLMSAFSKISLLFEQGYELFIKGRGSTIVIRHQPSHYYETNDCAYSNAKIQWVLVSALEALLGYKEPECSLMNNDKSDSMDLRLGFLRLIQLLEEVVALHSKNNELAFGILALFSGEVCDTEVVPTFTEKISALNSSSTAEVTYEILQKLLSNLKFCFHDPQKSGDPNNPLTYFQIRPYLTGAKLRASNFNIWKHYGFHSHAPLIQFIHRLQKYKFSKSVTVEKHTISKPNAAGGAKFTFSSNEAVFSTLDANTSEIQLTFETLFKTLTTNSVPASQTGYSFGDTLNPYIRLIESLKRNCKKLDVLVTKDSIIFDITETDLHQTTILVSKNMVCVTNRLI